MSVAYERWLIPKGNVFMPGPAAVAKLVARLRKERWIPEGGVGVRSVENRYGDDAAAKIAASTEPQPAVIDADWLDDADREELRLVWRIGAAAPLPGRYPLTHQPEGELSYALELHRAYDYVYPVSKSIAPLPSECACGEDLSFEWDPDEVVPPFGASTGIFAVCEACSRTFDPSKKTATITNPFDGRTEDVFGGAAYRFALKVDCGKCFVADPRIAFAPELVALLEDEFGGRLFTEIGSLS